MLTTDTFEKALDLLELGYTFPAITEETGITTEDAEAVHIAWFKGTSEQVSREAQLAGYGWDEGSTGDVLREILHVYPLLWLCCRESFETEWTQPLTDFL